MGAYDLLPLPFLFHEPVHGIGDDRAADALHRDRRQRVRPHHVAHERVRLVGEHDPAGLGDRLEARREVRLGADDRVLDAVLAAEVPDVAEARVDAHADAERALDAVAAPLRVQRRETALHLDCHAQAGFRVRLDAARLGVAEEDDDRVPDELVERAAVAGRDRGHLGQVGVEQRRQLRGLETLGRGREVDDVGEEDRELLALRRHLHVLVADEDAAIELGREIVPELRRDRREERVRLRELAVHARDERRLPALAHDEREAEERRTGEVREEVLEGEDARADRALEVDLLDAPHVADLPVALQALGVGVVAGDALRPHDDRRDEADAAVGDRAGDFGDHLIGVAPQRLEGLALERVELVRRALRERVVGEETIDRPLAVLDAAVLLADRGSELERERGGHRDGTGHVVVVGLDLRGAALDHAPDDVQAVVAAEGVDGVVEVGRLCDERTLGQVGEVEPDGDRQADEQQHDRDGRASDARPRGRAVAARSGGLVLQEHRARPRRRDRSDRSGRRILRGSGRGRAHGAANDPPGTRRRPPPPGAIGRDVSDTRRPNWTQRVRHSASSCRRVGCQSPFGRGSAIQPSWTTKDGPMFPSAALPVI